MSSNDVSYPSFGSTPIFADYSANPFDSSQGSQMPSSTSTATFQPRNLSIPNDVQIGNLVKQNKCFSCCNLTPYFYAISIAIFVIGMLAANGVLGASQGTSIGIMLVGVTLFVYKTVQNLRNDIMIQRKMAQRAND